MDGMGWVDGWSLNFFFGQYLENNFIFFLNYFISLKYMFLHIFWNIRGKKSECSFFQKASPKSGVGFFFDFLNTNSQISRKQLDIFFWLFLVPTEEFWGHFLELSELEKSENFPLKNRLTFFFLWKKNQNKNPFQEYLKNYSIFFPDCFWSPQKSFKDIFWNFPNWKNRKFFHSKIA